MAASPLDTFRDASGRPITVASDAIRYSGLLRSVELSFRDVIGAAVSRRDPRKLHIYMLRETRASQKTVRTDVITMGLTVETLEMATADEALELQSMVRLLATRCPSEPDRSKRLCLVMNPHGGRGKKAKQITYSIIVPLLEVAGLQCDVIETQYAGAFPRLRRAGCTFLRQ
jgi:hypothetical protein